MDVDAASVTQGDPHRRRAAHLYGLIVSGAVLATVPDDFRLVRVALVLLGTLIIYWAAETYAHWMAARTVHQRDLTRDELRNIVADGWPLVAASAIPLALLAAEALVGMDTQLAVDITLAVNAVLLFALGWRMGRVSGLTGARLLLGAAISGLLGVTLIALKSLNH